MSKIKLDFTAPLPPSPSFNIGVTGHRDANRSFSANRALITATLNDVFDRLETMVSQASRPTQADSSSSIPFEIRLHNMLVEGVDQISANLALQRGWPLIAPLPFGHLLNTAINSNPQDATEAMALLKGEDSGDSPTQQRAAAIHELVDRARCFELAEADDAISILYLDKLKNPTDQSKAQAFSFAASARVALAAQVLIEQSDLIIGVWDGASTSFTGGTGHTIALALSMGTPVLWIDANNPTNWQVLLVPEALAHITKAAAFTDPQEKQLRELVQGALVAQRPSKVGHSSRHMEGVLALGAQNWRPKSQWIWHGYRRVEALFGTNSLKLGLRNLTQTYERPDEILAKSAKDTVKTCADLLKSDPQYVVTLGRSIYERFAWADGISARLSDVYRGGMVMSFLFSAFAIVGGIAYLPFASSNEKWIFALFELALLSAILAITFVGQGRRWHGRWFETRRVAEYLRFAPILMILGVARPIGRWPKGAHTSWPEFYARHTLRHVGLPNTKITASFLRHALSGLLLPHITAQIQYHRGKAKRLSSAHHRLDHMSDWLFKLAVASVSAYLALKLAGIVHLIDHEVAAHFSKLFTFLGVLLPTFGGAIAGIRYFGDFERFSAISDITAQKLEDIAARSKLLLDSPDEAMTYDLVSSLAHATDDAVITEIESWQAVFSGKQVSVPV
jgi:hypothetical protein